MSCLFRCSLYDVLMGLSHSSRIALLGAYAPERLLLGPTLEPPCLHRTLGAGRRRHRLWTRNTAGGVTARNCVINHQLAVHSMISSKNLFSAPSAPFSHSACSGPAMPLDPHSVLQKGSRTGIVALCPFWYVFHSALTLLCRF